MENAIAILIDSHAHIYLEHFKKDRDDVVERASDTGISRILMPNVDGETIDAMLEAELKYDICEAMIGLHPCSVKKGFEKELYEVESWLSRREWIAIGEIGTDLYWDRSYWPQQQEAFRIQVRMAHEHDLPVVIHCRDSIDETIELTGSLGFQEYKGVFHCFTGTVEQARKITELGFCLGIGGVSTFKNNGSLDEVIREVPLEKLLLETDSPYLAPMPHRGKRNEPSYVRLVAEKVATIREISLDEVSEVTSNNCRKLFRLS